MCTGGYTTRRPRLKQEMGPGQHGHGKPCYHSVMLIVLRSLDQGGAMILSLAALALWTMTSNPLQHASPMMDHQRTLSVSSMPTHHNNDIPADNDNHRVPGAFMNNKLYILGLRLTTSYQRSDESVHVDMFGHAVGIGSNAGSFDLHKIEPLPNQLSFQDATKEELYCKVWGEDHYHSTLTGHHNNGTADVAGKTSDLIRMSYIPNNSLDKNTKRTHLIWRCNVSPFLTKSQLLTRSSVRVSVYTNPNNPHYPGHDRPILTVDVPTSTASVGHAGPTLFFQGKQQQQRHSFLEQVAQKGPFGVVLCVAGIDLKALPFLPEFVQHHINVGVDHMVLGVDNPSDIAMIHDKLSYFVEDLGVVVLGTESHVVENREVRKLRFYNQCLFHAKGMSEYVVNWDVDELWMPPLLLESSRDNHHHPHGIVGQSSSPSLPIEHDSVWSKSPYRKTRSLVDAIRSMRGSDGVCQEWCFQYFPSYTVQRMVAAEEEPHDKKNLMRQGFYGFPMREHDLNYQWKKPVIRTRYAFQSSFHLGGSCIRPEDVHLRQHVSKKYKVSFDDCPAAAHEDDDPRNGSFVLGAMHHYYRLFRPELGLSSSSVTGLSSEGGTRGGDVADEYTRYLRPTVLEQLSRLQNRNVQAAA
ncbi:expressed unknown protein [Seminavis robusta]|uniref:Glycosyltransferase family 92 protein n=1 Tax=Seminavis robusta TaxID=568900 RepID=A0A9N8DRY8_9STRA|nr:expressed unknown protein [Seminavis robusta]|eukprot:Sro310_g114020.1 n/a (636) ;mRNA; r:23980-25887